MKDVRSSIHAGTAWLVFDVSNIQKLALEKSKAGFSLLLNPGLGEENENVVQTAPSALGGTEDKEKGMFSRLIDVSLKPINDGIKVVLTSDGPSKYTVRKLSQPEKLVIRFQDTKLEIQDKLKKIKTDELENQKGGLLSIECRQIGPTFSPISEVMLTLVPGTVHQIDRDLNQLVLTLSAPPIARIKQESKKGKLQSNGFNGILRARISTRWLKLLSGEAGFELNFCRGATGGRCFGRNSKTFPLKRLFPICWLPGNYDYDLQGNTLQNRPTSHSQKH